MDAASTDEERARTSVERRPVTLVSICGAKSVGCGRHPDDWFALGPIRGGREPRVSQSDKSTSEETHPPRLILSIGVFAVSPPRQGKV
jgi:hypothetical protein